ncbi:MAG: hypothetical protein CVT92_08990 [Bacteroidetes bacterium HGW-Bacteroidetes-1]|jgi:hypothetical protein|nr:MAG: hypothetical protein CVT92_08990 [Bacteroidetes bacterium HGW-Bacteroidetes-1]
MKKLNILGSLLIATLVISFSSCKKDETVSKPQINLTELGYENSGIAYAGNDLHIEANIVADGKIDKVNVEIHHEGEHGKMSLTKVFVDEKWHVDSTYTKFSGLRNTSFHEHYEVSLDAEPGNYHFHFAVTDMDGNQTILERGIEIRQTVEKTTQIITDALKPISGKEPKSYTKHIAETVHLKLPIL